VGGTLFLPETDRLNARKQWLAFYHQPQGQIRIDSGAKTALFRAGKSLLAIGITQVPRGLLPAGDLISILDEASREIGRGLSNYDSGEVEKIKGRHSDASLAFSGHKDYDEVIHRDNLVLFPEGGSSMTKANVSAKVRSQAMAAREAARRLRGALYHREE